MFKKYLSAVLCGLLINLTAILTVSAATKPDNEVKFAEKVKAGIAKLGTGPDAKIQVKLRDGTKLKGYVSKIEEDYFVVTDAKTGATTTVAYPQVKQTKGNNLSTGVKIAIAIVIVAAILAFIGTKVD